MRVGTEISFLFFQIRSFPSLREDRAPLSLKNSFLFGSLSLPPCAANKRRNSSDSSLKVFCQLFPRLKRKCDRGTTESNEKAHYLANPFSNHRVAKPRLSHVVHSSEAAFSFHCGQSFVPICATLCPVSVWTCLL